MDILIAESEPIASTSNDDSVCQPSTSKNSSTPRPVGQKRAKMLQQIKDSKANVSWDEVLQEMKKKNEILELQTKEIQRASDIKIITTPLEGLDEMSKNLLQRLKEDLMVKFNSDFIEEVLQEEVITVPDLIEESMIDPLIDF